MEEKQRSFPKEKRMHLHVKQLDLVDRPHNVAAD